MTTIKTYKGFNQDMSCRDFQYKEGETYQTDEAVACESGFHACENPIDCLSYYEPSTSIYHEVEQSGTLAKHEDDTKVASTTIKIGARITIPMMVSAAFEYVKINCTGEGHHTDKDKSASSATGNRSASSATGYKSASSATGYQSASSATGYQSASSATGDRSASSATGNYSASSATGDRSASSATGDHSASSATGHYSASSATGCQSASSATGYQSASSATGYQSSSSATGHYSASITTGDYSKTEIKNTDDVVSQNSFAVGLGYDNRAKASTGNWIVLAEYDENGDVIKVHSKKVGKGKNCLKPDTWYEIKNGKFSVVK